MLKLLSAVGLLTAVLVSESYSYSVYLPSYSDDLGPLEKATESSRGSHKLFGDGKIAGGIQYSRNRRDIRSTSYPIFLPMFAPVRPWFPQRLPQTEYARSARAIDRFGLKKHQEVVRPY